MNIENEITRLGKYMKVYKLYMIYLLQVMSKFVYLTEKKNRYKLNIPRQETTGRTLLRIDYCRI